MTNLDAEVTTRYVFGGKLTGQDGYEMEFLADDSFKSWWSIVRWNWHYRHWRALGWNSVHLFTKVLRRKLWRR